MAARTRHLFVSLPHLKGSKRLRLWIRTFPFFQRRWIASSIPENIFFPVLGISGTGSTERECNRTRPRPRTILTQPNLYPTVLLATFPGIVGSDWQGLSIASYH